MSKSTVLDQALATGTGMLHIDEGRIFTNSAKPDAAKIADPPDIGINLHPKGRWPTNLLFVHSEGCRSKAQDADGFEAIASWECALDCPVAHLEAQSGTLTSGTGAVKKMSAQGTNANNSYGAESRPKGTPIFCYGDTGTAARFFPQFANENELVVWLTRLLLCS